MSSRAAGWSGLKRASACSTGTTQTQPHQISNAQRTENKTTDVVIQQHSRKLLMMDILMSETCCIHKKWNKIANDTKLVFYSSTITMMHGPISISVTSFLARKSLTKIDWCAGTLSWRKKLTVVPPHFELFPFAAPLRRRRMLMYISLFTVAIPVNYTSEFRGTFWSYSVHIKVKFSRYRAGVAQRVGTGIALFFHDRGTRRGWVVSSTPRPHFTPGKDPVPILREAGWAPGPVWTGGKSRPHRDSIPDRPARSQLLYRLSYPTHSYYVYTRIKPNIKLQSNVSNIYVEKSQLACLRLLRINLFFEA